MVQNRTKRRMRSSIPPREKLPRKCKTIKVYRTGVYEERERALECLSCGTVVPQRNPECRSSKLVKCLPREETVEIACSEELNCAICLNSMRYKRMLRLLCSHRFHKRCITQWFKEDIRCPLCRK